MREQKASLPDKPSDLITAAIIDLEKAEKMPDVYTINMGKWHEPVTYWYEDDTLVQGKGDERCAICFAGAVMAMELGCTPIENCMPSEYDDATKLKLMSLDAFRCGQFDLALDYWDAPKEKQEDIIQAAYGLYYDMPTYRDDPQKFKDSMREVAEKLRHIGL